MKKLFLIASLLLPAFALAETKIKTTGIADGAVTTDKIAGNAVTTDKVALDTLTAADLAPDSVGASEIASGAVGADELATTLNLSSKTITLPAANTPAFTLAYTSTNQTVTAAGALTLAHSLGGMPSLVQVRLKCLTAELGYSIGDEVIINPSASYVSSSTGLSLVTDATNVVVRFGSSGGGLSVIRKDTGALAIITAANWAMIVKAWR